jgi:hypothetical protein
VLAVVPTPQVTGPASLARILADLGNPDGRAAA